MTNDDEWDRRKRQLMEVIEERLKDGLTDDLESVILQTVDQWPDMEPQVEIVARPTTEDDKRNRRLVMDCNINWPLWSKFCRWPLPLFGDDDERQ